MQPKEYRKMDIAVKYKMISRIINSQDDRVLDNIKSLLNIDDETDFWDEMSVDDQEKIEEGLAQLDAGQHVSRASVQQEINSRFNF